MYRVTSHIYSSMYNCLHYKYLPRGLGGGVENVAGNDLSATAVIVTFTRNFYSTVRIAHVCTCERIMYVHVQEIHILCPTTHCMYVGQTHMYKEQMVTCVFTDRQ